MRTVALAVTAATLTAALAGCGATTASTPSSTAPSAASSASGSASPSGSRDAWVRGTHVTLTNGTMSAVEVKPYTFNSGNFSAGEGSYSPLPQGASTSATAEWATAAMVTLAMFQIKRPSGGVVAIAMKNPSTGTPYTMTCESSTLTGCDEKTSFTDTTTFDEDETKTVTTSGGAATFTVTRKADDDDNKNWAVSLTAIS